MKWSCRWSVVVTTSNVYIVPKIQNFSENCSFCHAQEQFYDAIRYIYVRSKADGRADYIAHGRPIEMKKGKLKLQTE